MKKLLSISVWCALLVSCSQKPARVESSEGAPDPVSVTVWTEKAELFLEYPPLVAGQKSRFAVHLTRLRDFRSVQEGACEVRLERAGAEPEIFRTDGPSRPGIFGVDVRPQAAGESRMTITLRSSSLTERFDLGVVKVATEARSVEAPAEVQAEETIAFLKEQQWALDFGTQVVGEQDLHEGLRVPAEILPRTGGEAEVAAPLSGRLHAERPPPLGTTVAQGAILASLLPPTTAPSDWAALQFAEAEAQASHELARRDRRRVERLLAVGAVPARRLDEAQTAEITAEARLRAAQSRLTQHEATREAQGQPAGAQHFLVRAPISGVIAQARATNGANVEAGEILFRIVDVEVVYAVAYVPEADLPRLRRLSGAELEIPGNPQPRPAGRLVSIGRLVDPASRTVPVIYEIDNRDLRLAVRQTVFLRLLLAGSSRAPVVSEAAIIDDAGRPIVFVQTRGESFVRRPVKLGNREKGFVQVLEGVKAGERVVNRGAYLIRLSAMSSQVPAHGHVH